MTKVDQVSNWTYVGCALAVFVLITSCAGERAQSILHPASDAAEEIAHLWWFMLIVCSIIFAFVVVLLFIAVISKRKLRPGPPLGETRFVVLTGVIMPTLVMVVFLLYSMSSTVALRSDETSSFTIEVIGHKWWWEVRYPDFQFVTANEIHIPINQKVHLRLSSADVIHSFWVPELQGKMDMLPDHVNEAWIAAKRPGIYRGQCAEYCGRQHAHMALSVIALSQQDFSAWLEKARQPTPLPATQAAQRGYQVFFDAACNTCHAISGTPADSVAGPNLTHMGSRQTIGAGTVVNNRGNLAGWLTDPQRMKPGNRMPRTFLDPEDLHNLVEYLEGLR